MVGHVNLLSMERAFPYIVGCFRYQPTKISIALILRRCTWKCIFTCTYYVVVFMYFNSHSHRGGRIEKPPPKIQFGSLKKLLSTQTQWFSSIKYASSQASPLRCRFACAYPHPPLFRGQNRSKLLLASTGSYSSS